MVLETQSRTISNTIRILYRHAYIQRSSSHALRRFTSSSLVRQNEPNQDGLNTSSNVLSSNDGGSLAESPATAGEVSRDMSSTAESSRSAIEATRSDDAQESRDTPSETNGVSDEDKQYAEIFATLNEELPKHTKSKTAKHPPKPESIADRLIFDGYSTPSPRHNRGVHSRLKRSSGQTPKEAETFNEILAGIFADLNNDSLRSSSPTSSSPSPGVGGMGGGPGGVKKGYGILDPYSTTRSGSTNLSQGFGFGLNNRNNGFIKNRAQSLRRFIDIENQTEGGSTEEDLEFLEELELLKEEMEVISSDTELIEWAKNRVFKPLSPTPPTGTTTSNDTPTSLGEKILNKSEEAIAKSPESPTSITYPATYPKILAHLLRTLRVNYNSPHLVLSLFNYAQNISLESYLSGCLTEVYNEVLLVRWESFRDLNGVELGIREMEIMGVGWDQITSRLISKIVEEISKDLLSSSSQTSSSTLGDSAFTSAGSGFSNLAGLTESNKSNEIYKKYGTNVLERINRLDEKVKRDIIKQEKIYETLQRRKRKMREERERKMEQNLKDDGHGHGGYQPQNGNSFYPNYNGNGNGDGSRENNGFISDPKEGERAFI